MTSGVPQESVLGPLLFVIFINTLVEVPEKSKIFLYADDLKLFHEVSDTDASCNIQNDLDKLQQWADTFLLKFHPDKCEHLQLKSKLKTAVATQYVIDKTVLTKKEDVKDRKSLI